MEELKDIISAIKNGLSKDEKLDMSSMIATLGLNGGTLLIKLCKKNPDAVKYIEGSMTGITILTTGVTVIQLVRKVCFSAEKIKEQVKKERFKRLISQPQRYRIDGVSRGSGGTISVSFGRRSDGRSTVTAYDQTFDIPDEGFDLSQDTANAIVEGFI